jgi:hypothetical protein
VVLALLPLLATCALAQTDQPAPIRLSAPLADLSTNLARAKSGGQLDQDADGLVDSAEEELAQAVRPWLVFDTHENARRPDEPFLVYQVRPLSARPLRARVTYLLLWERDGGYGPASWCGDSHIGDDQPVRVDLRSDDGWNFAVERVEIWGFTWPAHPAKFVDGKHFVLYNSSGKHHFFFDTAFNEQRSPYSKWGCRESMDGRGASFLSKLSGNVGEPERHPEPPFVESLGSIGMPGEHAWSTGPFCGGLACAKNNPTSPAASAWSKDPLPR